MFRAGHNHEASQSPSGLLKGCHQLLGVSEHFVRSVALSLFGSHPDVDSFRPVMQRAGLMKQSSISDIERWTLKQQPTISPRVLYRGEKSYHGTVGGAAQTHMIRIV